jgi:hypothetical protein
MQMRGCKDWVFGYLVCDVAHPRRTSSIHLAAEDHAKLRRHPVSLLRTFSEIAMIITPMHNILI